ncbi:MAG: methionyl-tRNA synthetase [archaeon GW2011_AR18]|nr:MAG: methionyl-tRNA synthetase [archaeon GW2011_AR18]
MKYEDFEKLDLRVATVKKVEDHPNADKLYVLEIDLGNETRTIVAGIKKYYTKEELIGKQIIVLANLEAAKLRGIESNGMLLAASDEKGNVIVLTPDKQIDNGSKIG